MIEFAGNPERKVLLVNPPSDLPYPIAPLGLAYMGAMLEKNGMEVTICDAWARGKQKHPSWPPEETDLIGVSMMSPTFTDSIKVMREFKEVCPNAKVVVGGTHPSSLPEECLKIPEVDYVITGEGDYAIVGLAKMLPYEKEKRIIKGGVVPDLNELPFPARHLLPMDRYTTHPPYRRYKKYATMITSRGCPYQCTYCTKSVSGQKLRLLNSYRVVSEMESLIEGYGTRQIHFYDDNFTIDEQRVEAICNLLISKRIRVAWSCVTRPDLVDELLLRKMREAGCWLISYGVESGSQQILNSVKKGYVVSQIKEAFEITRKVGIKTLGYFIAGLPGETKATLADTVDLSFSLKPNFVSWSVAALYPGSELYRQALKGKPGVSSQSPYAQGETMLFEGKIRSGQLQIIINQAYRQFYFRVGYLIKLLFSMRTWTEFVSYVQAFVQYLKWRKR